MIKLIPSLVLLSMFAFLFGLSMYGVYLAFSSSIILGVLVLIFEPAPLILGLVGLFGHPEVAKKIADWLGL